jgi:integrase
LARCTARPWIDQSNSRAKTLSTIVGQASVTITLDRYGHLFPGSEAEAGAQLDAYLSKAGGA